MADRKTMIFSDSTCDLPKSITDARNIIINPLTIVFGDDNKIDGVDITPDDVYAFFEKTGRLEVLPEQLFSAARLRMENPEASLNELCKLSNEPITVSGLNHRLQRIIEIYEELQ